MFDKIKKLFKKRNNKNDKENKDEIIERKKKEKEDILKYVRESMLNKTCPFRDEYCTSNCVHFEDGIVQILSDSFSSDGTGKRVRLKVPKCKLWNN